MNTAGWIISTALLMVGCSFEGSTGASPGAPAIVAAVPCGPGLEPVAMRTPSVIPDGDCEGLTLGPVSRGDNGEILGAVDLMVDLDHPNTADVALRLLYDQDNDGQIDAEAEVEFFRARRAGWSGAVANACPQSLDGAYYFSASGSDRDPLDVFRGLHAGGSFYLAVADTLAKDVGILRLWSVRIEIRRPCQVPASGSVGDRLRPSAVVVQRARSR